MAEGSVCKLCARGTAHPDDHDDGHEAMRMRFHRDHGRAVHRRHRDDDRPREDDREGDPGPAFDPATAALAAGAMAAGASDVGSEDPAVAPDEDDGATGLEAGSEASVFDS